MLGRCEAAGGGASDIHRRCILVRLATSSPSLQTLGRNCPSLPVSMQFARQPLSNCGGGLPGGLLATTATAAAYPSLPGHCGCGLLQQGRLLPPPPAAHPCEHKHAASQ